MNTITAHRPRLHEPFAPVVAISRAGSGAPRFVLGLDLGQAQDFTAVAILEHIPSAPGAWPTGEQEVFHVRHLDRYPLGVRYTEIVTHVAAMTNAPPLAGSARVALDATGVGRGIVDMFTQSALAAPMVPITITGGDLVSTEWEGGCRRSRVPKRDLVGIVQLLLQDRRLRVAPDLPHAATLTRELQNFQWKLSDSGHDTYGAWREGTHDDLLLAVALAAWTFGTLADRRVRFA